MNDKYEDERKLFLNINSYPNEIFTVIIVKTNFGEIIYRFDYPPSNDYEIGNIIQILYNILLSKLYKYHEKKGGKFLGDPGFEDYIKDNKTIIDEKENLIKKIILKQFDLIIESK